MVRKWMQYCFYVFLHIETGDQLGEDGIGGETVEYLLVLVEDRTGYTWLEAAAACTATVIAETPLRWCAPWALLRCG